MNHTISRLLASRVCLRQPYCLAVVSLFLLVWAALGWHRYVTGLHYLPVHVRVTTDTGAPPPDGTRVETRSPFRTAGFLESDPDEPGLFLAPWASPTTAVAIHLPAQIDASAIGIQVRSGQFWVAPSREMKIRSRKLDASPNGSSTSLLVNLEPLGHSFHPVARQTVNWQGDFSFMFVTATHAALVVTFFIALRHAVRRLCAIPKGARFNSGIRTFPAVSAECKPLALLGSLSSAAVIILLAHFAYHQVKILAVPVQDVRQHLSMVIPLCGASGAYIIIAQWSRKRQDATSLDRASYAFLGGWTLLKFVWILSVDTIQVGDYSIYWANAIKMAEGSWNDLPNPESTLNTAYVTRAIPYFFPIAALSGGSQTVLEIVNLLSQVLTLLIFHRFTRAVLDSKTALLALPAFGFFPNFWLATTIATHDIPGLLLLVIFFSTLQGSGVLSDRVATTSRNLSKTWLCCGGAIVVLGIIHATVEVQRSYGLLLSASLLVYLLAVAASHFWRRFKTMRRPDRFSVAVCLDSRGPPGSTHLLSVSIVIIGTIAVSSFLKTTALSALESRIGQMGKVDTIGQLTGIRKAGNGKWDDILTWSEKYYPSIPNKKKFDVARRKFLFEKVSEPLKVLAHIVRKNAELSGFSFHRDNAFGGVAPDQRFPKRTAVPWAETTSQLSALFGLALLTSLLLRIIFLDRLPLSSGELFPFLFCFVSFGIILIFGQAVSIYMLILIFPLSWSFGLIAIAVVSREGRFANANVERFTSAEVPTWTPWQKGLATGSVVLLGIGSIYLISGCLIDHYAPPFHRLDLVAPSGSGGSAGNVQSRVYTDRSGVTLEMRPREQSSVRTGDRVSASWRVQCDSDKERTLCFFLSLDQARRKLPFREDFGKTPSRVEAFLNGREVFNGTLDDLQKAKFISIVPDDLGRRGATLELILTAMGSWPGVAGGETRWPAISAEYFFSD